MKALFLMVITVSACTGLLNASESHAGGKGRNKGAAPAVRDSHRIDYPVHPGSQLPFSAKSSPDGACRALGFEKSSTEAPHTEAVGRIKFVVDAEGRVTKSSRDDIITIKDTDGRVWEYWRPSAPPQLDADGRPILHLVDGNYQDREIRRIHCLNRGVAVREKSALVLEPVHPQSKKFFTKKGSSPSAICRLLGYDRYPADSVFEGDESQPGTQINAEGQVIGQLPGLPVAAIVCIDEY